MRVLWSVNLIPANVSKRLGIDSEVLGGWVESMALRLSQSGKVELGVACKCSPDCLFKENVDNVLYYSLAYSSSTPYDKLIDVCEDIIHDFKPDIIQIEGTEFPHAKAMLEAADRNGVKAVVSMQGILNGQYAYQCGQLQIDDMMLSHRISDVFSAWILHLRKTKWYKPRMKPEREIIEKARYILGRTTWDRAHTYAINPNAKYYTCSRVLRKPFYEKRWSYETMEPHSIYVGNAYYALKGFHFLVSALPYLIREYPDIKVYAAGYKPFEEHDKRSIIKQGYGVYLKKLIENLGVGAHIEFTGALTAEQVADRLSKSNVYALCSAIENSPNTLGEAMCVGTPCVSAYVGGAPDMAQDGKEALFYRNDDPELLAWRIKQIFDSRETAEKLSENGRRRALITHDPEGNVRLLIDAYSDMLRGEQ